MGCCQSENKSSTLSQNVFGDKLKEAIDSGSVKTVHLILGLFQKKEKSSTTQFIDREIISINGRHFSALSYCMHAGNEKIFRYLYEKGASLQAAEELLESQNMRSINLICMKGHLNLLKFYLPLYLKSYNSFPVSEKSYTYDFVDTPIKNGYELAIHSACRAEGVQIISYLYSYFKDKEYCPREFDIKSVNEQYGEDCALTACRRGNFNLVKMLHESCSADFTKLNNNKENAIMICISGCNKQPKFSYLECISYLVEIVKVDVTYMYEEALVLAENQDIVSYLEMRLQVAGVNAKKSELDQEALQFRVIHDEDDNSKQPIFTDEVRGYLSSSNPNSMVSSIRDCLSKRIESSTIDILVPE